MGEVGKALLAKMPEHLRAAAETVEVPEGETQQDRAERLERQRTGRVAKWAERLPAMYADATLAGLHDWQDPEGRVRGWLERTDSLTLVLVGPADRGKTHAAYAVGAAALAGGATVIAYTLADLNAAMRPDGDSNAYDRAVSYDVLLLDDLGREQVTPWSLEQVQRILDARTRDRLRTIITTNLTSPQIEERYGSPVLGRITYSATIAKIEGPSLRKAAAW
jgi:DNA replication protein DnaC